MPASLSDLVDITETRRLLECHAARLSLARADLEWESRLVAAYHKLSKVEELVVDRTRPGMRTSSKNIIATSISR